MSINNSILSETDPLRYETNETIQRVKKKQEEAEKQSKEDREIERLCYEIFHMTEDGKKLKEKISHRLLYRMVLNPNSDTATTMAIYLEAYRSAILGLFNMAESHAQRIVGVNG